LKLLFVILVVLVSICISKAYADDYNFGTRLLPDKIISNSKSVLEVFATHNGQMLPQKIENLTYSSTDSSVLKIQGIENQNGFITNLKLESFNDGKAKIILAAPGFTSQEIPITVYKAVDQPSQLLIKTTPSLFSDSGPKEGYVSVELIDSAGLPTGAGNDTQITLSTNDDIIDLQSSEITIKKGDYYGIAQFLVKQSGTSKISAYSNYMQSVSASVTINRAQTPTIQVYVYPNKINDFAASNAYVIAQLVDSKGNLIPATEDIQSSVSVTNASKTELRNISSEDPSISSDELLVIKKGSYWGISKLFVKAGIAGTYKVSVSANNGYHVSSSAKITTVPIQFLDDKSARVDLVPILATGKEELIGILHLQDSNGNPMIASHNLQIRIDSSDPNSITVDRVQLNQGTGVTPVFAKMGNTSPVSPTLHVVTYDDQTLTPTITVPQTNSAVLKAESLIQKVLLGSNFPTGVYMIDFNNTATTFPGDMDSNILPNQFINTKPQQVKDGDPVAILDSDAIMEGSSTLTAQVGPYQTSMSVNIIKSDDNSISLNFPQRALTGLDNTVLVEILNSKGNPTRSQTDLNIKLVSTDQQVAPLPDNITMNKGDYYTSFNIKPLKDGKAKISVLANDIPLSTFDVQSETLAPVIKLQAPDIVDNGNSFSSNVTVSNGEIPLSGMKIYWAAEGAQIQNSDSLTSQDGTASALLIPTSTDKVSLSATVSGSGFPATLATKIININNTLGSDKMNSFFAGVDKKDGTKPLQINGIDPIPIIIPLAIGIVGIMIKKKSLFNFQKNKNQTKNILKIKK